MRLLPKDWQLVWWGFRYWLTVDRLRIHGRWEYSGSNGWVVFRGWHLGPIEIRRMNRSLKPGVFE